MGASKTFRKFGRTHKGGHLCLASYVFDQLLLSFRLRTRYADKSEPLIFFVRHFVALATFNPFLWKSSVISVNFFKF